MYGYEYIYMQYQYTHVHPNAANKHVYMQISRPLQNENTHLTYPKVVDSRVVDALLHTSTHFNTLQHASRNQGVLNSLSTHCNTLQHTATQYNTMQHNATHCALQHSATNLTDPRFVNFIVDTISGHMRI